jgi:hypothetical protein
MGLRSDRDMLDGEPGMVIGYGIRKRVARVLALSKVRERSSDNV